jgi:hypothetical protein
MVSLAVFFWKRSKAHPFRLQLQNLTGHTPLCGIAGGQAERGWDWFSAGGGVSYCGHTNKKVLKFDFAVIPILWVSQGGLPILAS